MHAMQMLQYSELILDDMPSPSIQNVIFLTLFLFFPARKLIHTNNGNSISEVFEKSQPAEKLWSNSELNFDFQ